MLLLKFAEWGRFEVTIFLGSLSSRFLIADEASVRETFTYVFG
jgi:hypothetical protein